MVLWMLLILGKIVQLVTDMNVKKKQKKDNILKCTDGMSNKQGTTEEDCDWEGW